MRLCSAAIFIKNHKKKSILIFVIILLGVSTLILPGCSKKEPSPEELNNISLSNDLDKIMKLNEQIFSSATTHPDHGDYLIGPGDLLEVEVFESEKLNATVRVSSRGFISLPLLGEISIEGLTASEAETLVENEYKKSYIKNPHVSIFIKENYSQRVTVIGQVKKPGTYDYPSKQRLLDALALAGGLSENASQTIQVRRLSTAVNGGAGGPSQVLLINLDKLISEGKSDLNININGGDIIFVPEAGIFYVGGAVHNPGKYHIKKTMSIKEALSAAGGLQPWADLEDITILRYVENSDREKITLNLENSSEQSDSFIIQDRDIITVDASFWGNLVYGSGFLIGVPGLGYNYRNPER